MRHVGSLIRERRSAGKYVLLQLDITFAGDYFAALAIHGFVARLRGGQAVDVAVVHAEGRGDENGIVNFNVGSA